MSYKQYATETIDHEYRMALAVIQEFGHIGAAQDVATLTMLAGGKSYAENRPKLKVAAKASIILLTERLERMKPHDTLLRASAAPEELLRPAGFTVEADPAVLLRSVGVNESNEVVEL